MNTAYDDIVMQLEQVEGRDQRILALRAAGEDAKPALLRGMQHPAWRVRFGCLLVIDHTIIDDPTRRAVLRALEDPHRKVRKMALHVLGCERCKPEGYCGIEGVDLEAVQLEMATGDPSGRVRSGALGAFMWRDALDDRVAGAMQELLATDSSNDVRLRAARVLAFPEVAGMSKTPERRARFVEAVETLLQR